MSNPEKGAEKDNLSNDPIDDDLDIPEKLRDVIEDEQLKHVIKTQLESGRLAALVGVERRHTQIACGPIPPPKMLAEYKEVDPRILDQFLNAWNEEINQRHCLERKKMDAITCYNDKTFAERRWGQLCATAISIAAFLTAAYMAYLGHPVAAAAIGGTTLVSIVAIFITGKLPAFAVKNETKDLVPAESKSPNE